MNNKLLKIMLSGATVMGLTFASCEKDNGPSNPVTDTDRWITISGALMKTNPGDGDGGTNVYSISAEQAR